MRYGLPVGAAVVAVLLSSAASAAMLPANYFAEPGAATGALLARLRSGSTVVPFGITSFTRTQAGPRASWGADWGAGWSAGWMEPATGGDEGAATPLLKLVIGIGTRSGSWRSRGTIFTVDPYGGGRPSESGILNAMPGAPDGHSNGDTQGSGPLVLPDLVGVAVPEPASLGLLMAGGILVLGRREIG